MNPTEFLQFHIQHSGVIGSNTTGVIAVSGGADSMALLHATAALRDTLHVRLSVATFNHGLRGQNGADDAMFVGEMSKRWGVPCVIGHGTLDPAASGVESRARAARYAFLAGVMRDVGADWLATAHHADDQAETVLMHLIRGAGMAGLRGMRPIAPLPFAPALTLIRPLLGVRRADLLAYCEAAGVPYRHDQTNDDPTYRRNWVRHVALPTLAHANPDVSGALIRLSEAAGIDDDLLNQLAQPVILTASVTTGRVIVPRQAFTDLHPALRVRVVAWACGRLDPSEPSSFEHLRGAAALAEGQTGGRVGLAGGLGARLEHDSLIIERTDSPDGDAPPVLGLPAGGRYPLAMGEWSVLPDGAAVCWMPQIGAGEVDFYAESGQSITLRTPISGERIRPLGLVGHSKRLKDWLIDHKIPHRWRAFLPVLAVDGVAVALWDGRRWHRFEPESPPNHSLAVKSNS